MPCSLGAFTMRKYDPKPGQSKMYDFVVETLKQDIPACLSKVDKVLTNRCTRGSTTPLWHHTPLAPHHSHSYYTTPQPSVLTPPGRQNGGAEGPCRRLFHHRFLWDGHLLLRPTLRPGRQHLHCRHRGGGTRPQRLRRGPNPAAPRHAPTHAWCDTSRAATS